MFFKAKNTLKLELLYLEECDELRELICLCWTFPDQSPAWWTHPQRDYLERVFIHFKRDIFNFLKSIWKYWCWDAKISEVFCRFNIAKFRWYIKIIVFFPKILYFFILILHQGTILWDAGILQTATWCFNHITLSQK